MTSVEVYPLLLTIEEAAEVLPIGRSLAYGLAHQYGPMGGRGCRSCGSGRYYGYRAGHSPSSSSRATSFGWPMVLRVDAVATNAVRLWPSS